MNVNGTRKSLRFCAIHTSMFKFSFFFKYWPDDGPVRPKLVANSRIKIYAILCVRYKSTIYAIYLCQTEYIYS